jgi:hypothetical protein
VGVGVGAVAGGDGRWGVRVGIGQA